MAYDFDYGTLSWVKSEIDETLKQARGALEAYVDNDKDETQLRFCVNYLHQVHGTLQMVELYGAALVAEEMERLANALIDGKVVHKNDSYEALMRGMLQLPDYLEHLQGGHRDMPVVLLPLLNDLRAARGDVLMSESALFSPDLSVPIPASSGTERDGEDLGMMSRKLRHIYHLGLLGWFRDQDRDASLQKIGNVIGQLRQAATEHDAGQLFWAAHGVVEGLLDGGLESSVALKLLLGQVDRQVKRIIDAGQGALAQDPPRDLVKNLLYYVAQAQSEGKTVKALKSAFHLKDLLPDAKALDKARADLAGPNTALLETVSKVILEDLGRIKDKLDVFVRSEQRDVAALKPLGDSLTQMADTLAMLGLGVQRKVVQDQVRVLNAMVEGERAVEDGTLMDVAGALLALEASLHDVAAVRAANDEAEEAAAAAESGDVSVGNDSEVRIYQDAEYRHVANQVIGEARAEMLRVKEAIAAFNASPHQHALLKDVPTHLGNIRGSLSMLNLNRAGELVESCQDYVSRELVEHRVVPAQESLDTLADAITSIEYYLEAIAERWGHPKAILEIAAQSLQQLLDGVAAPVSPSQVPGDTQEIELGTAGLEARRHDAEVEDTHLDLVPLPSAGEEGAVLEAAGADDTQILEIGGIDFDGALGSTTQTDLSPLPNEAVEELTLEALEPDQVSAVAVPEPPLAAPTGAAVEPQRLVEALDMWLLDPLDRSATELLHTVVSQLGERAAAEGAAAASQAAQVLARHISAIASGNASLDNVGVDELYMARDNLLAGLSGTASAPRQIDVAQTAAEDAGAGEAPEEIAFGAPAEVGQTVASPADRAEPSTQTAPAPGRPDDIDDEIIDIFLEEASEELANIARLLPRWRENQDDHEALRDLRRSFHTLKGSGRLVGAVDIGEFAWAFENMLNRVIDHTVPATPMVPELVARAHQTLPHLCELFRTGGKPGRKVFVLMEHAHALTQGREVKLDAGEEEPEPGAGSAPRTAVPVSVPEPASIAPPIDPVLLDIYRKEADGHLSGLRGYIDTCRAAAGECLVTDLLIRALHTLHGSSRTATVIGVAELAGLFEKYAKVLDQKHLPLPADGLALLEESVDFVERVLSMLDQPEAALPDRSELMQRLNGLLVMAQELDAREAPPVAPPTTSQELPAPGTAAGAEYDEELLDIFLEEGGEILDNCDNTLQRWMGEPDNSEIVEILQRELHTLKGGARMAGVVEIGDLSHRLESLLTAVADGHVVVAKRFFDVLHLAQDRLAQMLDNVRAHSPLVPAKDIVTAIEELLPNAAPRALPDADVQLVPPAIEAEPVPEMPVAEEPLPCGDEPAAVAPQMATVLPPAPPPVVTAPDPAPDRALQPSGAGEGESVEDDGRDRRKASRVQHEQIRVRADLLDNLVNFAGEVSIYRSRLEQQVNSFRYNLTELDDTVARLREQLRRFEIETEAQIQYRYEEAGARNYEDFDPLEFDRFTHMQQLSRGMLESLGDLDSLKGLLTNLTRESETLLLQQSRVNTELQEGLMRSRMVPFSGQAPRMRRIVRQACNDLRKDAELHLIGAESELDRTVLDRVMAPLEHMLRNSVAHGIEAPQQRRAAGKPASGTISIALTREGSEIVIRVSDDGAGIDMDAIRAKAIKRGRIAPDAQLSEEALLDLILESGFSTAKEITQIAGRGVGMDVVSSEIKQLGGTLSMETRKGQGTQFTVRLPLTLSVTRALLVYVGDDVFAIPLLSVEGIERVGYEELEKLYAQEQPAYDWLGQDYRFLHLGSMMGLSKPVLPAQGKKVPVLITRSGDYRAALHIDGLIGSREVVVKPVGPQLSTLRGVSGATIMGDGAVVLILDLGNLIRHGIIHDSRAVTAVTVPALPAEEAVPLVMVVDDSITVRKVTTRLLERNNIEVLTAKDGVDALALLQEHVPDVLLLDIEMPRMDGFELATNVRNDERLRHIPIIMITSRTGDKHRDRAMQIGVNKYMGKPFQETDLLANIQELLAAR